MSLLTWIRRSIRGPYQLLELTPSDADQYLFECKFGSYSIVVNYNIYFYQYRFKKWFIPDTQHCHAIMQGTAVGEPPEKVVRALKQPVFLYLGENPASEELTPTQALRMSIFFNDVLSSRMLLR